MLAQPLDGVPSFLENLIERLGNIDLLFEQADTKLTLSRLVMISAHVWGWPGRRLGAVLQLHSALLPLMGMVHGRPAGPLALLAAEEASEGLRRPTARRAGHALPRAPRRAEPRAGFSMVASEDGGAAGQGVRPRVRGTEPGHPSGGVAGMR